MVFFDVVKIIIGNFFLVVSLNNFVNFLFMIVFIDVIIKWEFIIVKVVVCFFILVKFVIIVLFKLVFWCVVVSFLW